MEKCRKQLATLANSLCHNHNQNNNNNFQPYLTHRETYDCATCYHLLCEHRRQTVKSKFVSCEKQSKCGWQIFLQRQIFIYLQADAWAATCNAQIIIKHENANKIKYRDSVQHATAWLQQQQRAGKRLSARGDRYINMVNKVTPANRAGHSKQQQQQTNTHTKLLCAIPTQACVQQAAAMCSFVVACCCNSSDNKNQCCQSAANNCGYTSLLFLLFLLL